MTNIPSIKHLANDVKTLQLLHSNILENMLATLVDLTKNHIDKKLAILMLSNYMAKHTELKRLRSLLDSKVGIIQSYNIDKRNTYIPAILNNLQGKISIINAVMKINNAYLTYLRDNLQTAEVESINATALHAYNLITSELYLDDMLTKFKG